jgi:hypothetical protein
MSALTDLNVTMFEAARGGHLAVVKYMIEKGANEFKLAMMEACVNGHIEIVKLMIENVEKKTGTSKQYGRVDLINGWSAVMDVDQDGHLNIFITNEDGSDISECETEYSDGENGELGLRYTTDNIEKKYHHENIVRWLQTNHKTWEAVVKDVTAIVWLTDDMETFKTNLWWANGDSSYEGDYKCINKAKIACMRAIDKHEKENK